MRRAGVTALLLALPLLAGQDERIGRVQDGRPVHDDRRVGIRPAQGVERRALPIRGDQLRRVGAGNAERHHVERAQAELQHELGGIAGPMRAEDFVDLRYQPDLSIAA